MTTAGLKRQFYGVGVMRPRFTENVMRMYGTTIHACLVAAAIASTVSLAAGQMRQTEEETEGVRYLMALPPGHVVTSPGKWPVLVFLHGSGESGTDLMDLMVHSIPAVVESDYWDWPFIVISPQSEGGGFGDMAPALTAILARMETEFHAEPNRYYLTGLSMGGEGTFNLGVQMDGVWAALMPLCAGGTDNFETAPFADTPLFVIHGDADNDNPYSESRGMVDQLIAAGTDFFEFDYPMADQFMDNFPTDVLNYTHVFATMNDYGHDVWTATYGVRDQNPKKTVPYNWLLAQSLNGSPFVDPLDPAQPPNGGAGGMAGAAGAGGAAGAAGAGGAGTGGMASAGSAGVGGSSTAGSSGAAGASAAGAAGAPMAAAGMPAIAAGGAAGSGVAAPATSTDSEGGGCALTTGSSRVAPWLGLTLGLLLAGLRRNRRRAPSVS